MLETYNPQSLTSTLRPKVLTVSNVMLRIHVSGSVTKEPLIPGIYRIHTPGFIPNKNAVDMHNFPVRTSRNTSG